MSSQRLQAQRAGRSSSTVPASSGNDGYSDAASNTNRHSIGSSPPLPEGMVLGQDHDLPPRSRDTETTQPDTHDRGTGKTSPSAYGTVRSATESVTPLQGRTGDGSALQKDYLSGTGDGAVRQKSPPKSFRPSFLLPSRASAPKRVSVPDHDGSSSTTSSPHLGSIKPTPDVRAHIGKNHQYFSGNTVFCWGGRLQNTRHRPINIATGLFVFIPGVLFLAYS